VVGIAAGLWFGLKHGAKGAIEAQTAVVIPAALAGVVVGGWLAFRFVRRSFPGPLRSGALLPVGWKKTGLRPLIIAAAAGAALACFYRYGLLTWVPPPPDRPLGALAKAAASGGWARHGWAFLALFVAPPTEEFVFRGALFTGFRRTWSATTAGALVTLLFVIAHLPEAIHYLPAILALTMMALAALWARLATGSLLPAVVLHTFYNLAIAIAVYAR
jgi:membrane protease YdiL (CAAX protease family)